jgi:hypothetical protein
MKYTCSCYIVPSIHHDVSFYFFSFVFSWYTYVFVLPYFFSFLFGYYTYVLALLYLFQFRYFVNLLSSLILVHCLKQRERSFSTSSLVLFLILFPCINTRIFPNKAVDFRAFQNNHIFTCLIRCSHNCKQTSATSPTYVG